MPFYQLDKVLGSKERQRRLRKMWIFRKEILRPAVQIRKIASSAARNKDLPPRLPIVIEHRNPPTALPGHRRAH